MMRGDELLIALPDFVFKTNRAASGAQQTGYSAQHGGFAATGTAKKRGDSCGGRAKINAELKFAKLVLEGDM
jgi:hypothetical protein